MVAKSSVVPPADPEVEVASAQLNTWLERKTKPRAKTIGNGAWEDARREAQAMMGAGDWSAATPRHFVAAYEMMHTKVYGVAPAELTPQGRMAAAGAAYRILEKEFEGDRQEMADFVRWTWVRENTREQKLRAGNTRYGGFRVGWRLQFGPALVTDYRLAKARRQTTP